MFGMEWSELFGQIAGLVGIVGAPALLAIYWLSGRVGVGVKEIDDLVKTQEGARDVEREVAGARMLDEIVNKERALRKEEAARVVSMVEERRKRLRDIEKAGIASPGEIGSKLSDAGLNKEEW